MVAADIVGLLPALCRYDSGRGSLLAMMLGIFLFFLFSSHFFDRVLISVFNPQPLGTPSSRHAVPRNSDYHAGWWLPLSLSGGLRIRASLFAAAAVEHAHESRF